MCADIGLDQASVREALTKPTACNDFGDVKHE